jgi:Serine aminopeptidase, S33
MCEGTGGHHADGRPVSRSLVTALTALAVIILSVVMLERGRAGLQITDVAVGTTPATFYQRPDSAGPVVVIAHGFAGSRPLMQAYALSLAQSGYGVLSYDLEGHGRNPVPMSGDVTSVVGTTALLVAETRRAIAKARSLPGGERGVALLGHSMATDIIVRAANAEEIAGAPVDAVIAISMFSQAVTATAPKRLLVISGAWESVLRKAALDAVRLVAPAAKEGETVSQGGVIRRAVVAPAVEHVGVLFSATAIKAARDWLDTAYERTSTGPVILPGLWILALLAGIVVLFHPLAARLPQTVARTGVAGTGRFLAAILVPAVAVPLLLPQFYTRFLPVLVADYLLLHLALFGAIQLLILRVWHGPVQRLAFLPVFALVFWGIAVFGLALDRYAASFLATPERLLIIAALAVGTVPFMVADSYVTDAGRGALWRRLTARLALLSSLAAAALIDPDRLIFLFIILPVVLLFFVVHGLMGRWVAQRSGELAAGIGLGLILAWALGVSFPLFSAG